MPRHLIGTLEWLCGSYRPALKIKFPLLLKALYDADILEEEHIVGWAAVAGATQYSPEELSERSLAALRLTAQPLVTWLEEAESDDDSEDDA